MDATQEPLSVDHVRAALEHEGLSVRELPHDTSTAVLAATVLGTTVGSIVKSLVFMADGQPVLLLVSGDHTVARDELASELGVKAVRLAKPDEVLSISGYAVGGVPPVAHRRPLRTLLDRGLLGHSVVYAAAGSPNAIFAVSPEQLMVLTGASLTGAAG